MESEGGLDWKGGVMVLAVGESISPYSSGALGDLLPKVPPELRALVDMTAGKMFSEFVIAG